MLELKIEALPPTVNTAYGFTHMGGYLKRPGKDFKMLVRVRVKQLSFSIPDVKETYTLSIEFHSKSWRNKDGTIKKRDVSNLIKIAEDAFIEAIGIDDSRFWELHIKKVEDSSDFTVFKLS